MKSLLIAEQKVNDAWFAPSRELNIKITMAGEVFDRTSVTSLSFDSGSISGETFQIGSAHMNQIQLEFPSIIQTIQKDLELSVELGILVEGSFHYSKLGTFLISEFDRNYNDKKTTITAVDKMCLLEGIYQSKLTYPSSMRNVALEIANLNGVEIDQVSFTRIPTTLIGQPVGYTSRQAIGLIAQFIGGFANFNREGKLQVKTLEPTEFVIGTENYLLKGFTKNESKYRINGISVKIGDKESDVLIVGETKGNVIHLENKIMTQDLLNSIWSNVKDIIYYPFELKWQGNPNLEAGDWFYVKDREGTLFSVPNLSYSFTYNGGMRADSKATTATNSEVTYKYGGTLQQQVKEIFKRLPSANGWNANHYDSETEPENPRIGDLWFRKNGEAEEIWSYDLVGDSPTWVLKVSSAPNKELKEAIEEVKRIVQETSELAEKNTKQINDALESGEVLSLKDLFARKIGTDEFNTLFYQETNAIGLTYFVDGVMEAIIAIRDGIPLIKGKHIVLDGDTIIDGDFTVTGDMLADSAVIDKLKVQGIDAAQINVTNLNANSFTTGDIDALKIRIMAGDVPVMSVDDTGEVVFNVTKMKIGNIEAATKEDVTNAAANKVTSSNVEYYLSNSTTSLIGGSWQITAPLWVDGKYMWQRTKVVLGDGTIKYTPGEDGTCVSGGVGPSGDDGISVTSIQEYYAVSTSNTTAPTTWQTTVQQMTVTNKYLWNYEEFSLSDESKIATKKRVIGVYGDKGPQGNEGKGIKSNAVTYQIGDSGMTAPVGTWNVAIPTPVKGKYLWTRTITTYTDNTNSTIYSVSYLPTDGQNGGAGVGVQSTEITYQLHTNGTTAPTGAWTTTIPTPIKGRYLWTKTVITYTNSTTSTAYSTSYYPLDGQTGNPGIDGNSISSVTNYYLASASATGVTTATAGWTMTVQVPTTAKKYLWNYEVIKYSKIADTITTPTIIGVYGETGSTGKGVTSITAEYALSESKTTAPTTWLVTAPIWESGKYIWTRSKIVYSNPTSTAYTTPIVDSSWEAVNELEESTQEKLDEKANSNDLNEGLGNVWEELEDKAEKGELSEIELLARKLQESYEAYVDPENGIAKENLDALYDRMNGFILELQDKIATFDFIHTTIKLGEEGLSIGSSESSLKMLLTNNRLSFMDGGQEVAYFSGQSFYINRGAVVQSLQIGQHKITNLGNGHTVIQWVGG